MTQQEFDNTGWHGGMRCIYQGNSHDIGSCDFKERLVGIVVGFSDDLSWIRCENIKLIKDGE